MTTLTGGCHCGNMRVAFETSLDPRNLPLRGCQCSFCRRHGAVATSQRVVEHLDQRLVTSAGVSSGIDMALRLVELLFDRTAAEAAQLMIEYDPQPAFDSGSVAKSSEAVMARVIEYAGQRR